MHPSNLLFKLFDCVCCDSFNGRYIGVGGGGLFSNGRTNILADNRNFFPNTINGSRDMHFFYNANKNLKSSSPEGVLFVGYGKSWNPFYLGGELFASVSSSKMRGQGVGGELGDGAFGFELLTSAADSRVKLFPLGFGADLRPGVLITPLTLFFGRIGVAVNKVKFRPNIFGTSHYHFVIPPAGDFTFPLSLSSTVNRAALGLRLGAGLERRLSRRLTLRLDYTYTFYQPLRLNGSITEAIPSFNPSIGAGSTTVSNSSKVKLASNAILLGLSYYFN